MINLSMAKIQCMTKMNVIYAGADDEFVSL